MIWGFLVTFLIKKYKSFSRITEIFWNLNPSYFIRHGEMIKIFYQQKLYARLLHPKNFIAKFFSIEQVDNGGKTRGIIKSVEISSNNSLETSDKFGSNCSSFGELKIMSPQSRREKNIENIRRPIKKSFISIIFLQWCFILTCRWILFLILNIICIYFNFYFMDYFESKIQIKQHILQMEADIFHVKALNSLWTSGSVSNVFIQEEYLNARHNGLENIYQLINFIETSPYTDSATNYFETLLNKDISKNETYSTLSSLVQNSTNTNVLNPEAEKSKNGSLNSDSISKNPFDIEISYNLTNVDYIIDSRNQVLKNFTNINELLRKGFKHAYLSFLSLIDYNLIFSKSINKDSSKIAWLFPFQEKLMDVLAGELQSFVDVITSNLFSLFLAFVIVNVVMLILMVANFVWAIHHFLNFQSSWRNTTNMYVNNTLNLISNEEIAKNPKLIKLYSELLPLVIER